MLGIGFGKFNQLFINKIKLNFDGLYPVLVIALMFLTFSATDFIGGNGFLAVYLSAVFLGNQELIHKKGIIKAFDGYAWLMQIVLFLTLGLLVFPSQLMAVTGIGLLISAFLILIARPISVFLSLMFFKVRNRSRWYISWVGLRGAVPIVFATYPLLAGVERAHMIFNIVFFISLTSVLLQGTTLSVIVKWLHVSLPSKVKPKTTRDKLFSDYIKSEMVEVVLPPDSLVAGRSVLQLGFPSSTLITMLERDGQFITPNGSTVLEPLDKLIILSDNQEGITKAISCLKISEEDIKSA
ncbi:MAG: antiporter [Adhaeribacter sp.]|nr:antiporter [Adhaeribacter sp.]